MEMNSATDVAKLRHAHPDAWKPALVRSTAPYWGPEERRALDTVLSACRENFGCNLKALKTLQDNQISIETAEHFDLGFADRSISAGLPSGETYDGARLRGRLQSIGVVRLSGHGHFGGSIVAPVRDINGRVTDIYGRKITPRLRMGTAYHTCIFDPPKGVFNLEGLAGQKQVVLCNDLFDALRLHSAGVTNVTTTVGPRGFTDTHMRVLAALGVKKVVIAFAAGAGEDRTGRLVAQALDFMGIECSRMSAPSEVHSPAALSELVRTAPLFKQCAETLFKEARQ